MWYASSKEMTVATAHLPFWESKRVNAFQIRCNRGASDTVGTANRGEKWETGDQLIFSLFSRGNRRGKGRYPKYVLHYAISYAIIYQKIAFPKHVSNRYNAESAISNDRELILRSAPAARRTMIYIYVLSILSIAVDLAAPSSLPDKERIGQQPVKVIISSTCHHAYSACK